MVVNSACLLRLIGAVDVVADYQPAHQHRNGPLVRVAVLEGNETCAHQRSIRLAKSSASLIMVGGT